MENNEIDPRPFRPTKRRMILTIAGVLLVLSVLVIAGVIPRLRAAAEVRDDHERLAHEPAKVQVEHPARPAEGGKVMLPSTIQPVQDAVVYARTTGYVHQFNVDIGDQVKAGQVLATLDTPDIDQELRAAQAATVQAGANIDQAKTQLTLAQTESARYQSLAGSGVVSQQDMEEHRASYDARGANLKAMEAARGTADANLARLRELKGFATVAAPFDGVVTQRNVELGQLVAAGVSQPMFRVANTAVVRVFVNVPQSYAPGVHVGDAATVALREYAARPFTGKVARTSRALDPATRTLLAEIRIDNPDGALLPGMYARVTLGVARVDPPLMIRPSSLVADASGTRVAVVEGDAIHWKQVQVDSDLGDEIAILSGITDKDSIVVAPSEKLAEGLVVKSELAPKPKAMAAAAPPPPAPISVPPPAPISVPPPAPISVPPPAHVPAPKPASAP
ncbi:MAG TPA: efflux RND transporter periplasmic adaptor subunit [Kofleriaceae bacterium]